MAVQNITTLKSYFETGDIPTQAEFVDVFDTMFDASSTPVTATQVAFGSALGKISSSSNFTWDNSNSQLYITSPSSIQLTLFADTDNFCEFQMDGVTGTMGFFIDTLYTPLFRFAHTVQIDSLTASTIVYSNGSKQLVSLADGTTGQVLTTNGAGVYSWTTISSGCITSLNGLTGATQTFVDDTNVTIVSAGTTHTITWAGTLADGRIASAATWNAMLPKVGATYTTTTGAGLALTSSTITSGSLATFTLTGTAALTGQKAVVIDVSGANGTGAQTTYGLYSTNTHTGTSVNVAGYFSASGGSSNYGLIVAAGQVGIGTTTPTASYALDVNGAVNIASNIVVGSAAASSTISGNLRLSNGSSSTVSFIVNNSNITSFRYTNGGSSITPNIAFGFLQSTNTAGAASLMFETNFANGIIFAAGNGTRPIARAGINIASLVDTAGSEKADLIFTTQNAGAGLVERFRIGWDGLLTIADAGNITIGTTTGTKIGTSTSQKIALWNKTPIVQPTTAIGRTVQTINGGAAISYDDTFGGYTVDQLFTAVISFGLLA